MKRTVSILLVLVLALGLTSFAFAEEEVAPVALSIEQREQLLELRDIIKGLHETLKAQGEEIRSKHSIVIEIYKAAREERAFATMRTILEHKKVLLGYRMERVELQLEKLDIREDILVVREAQDFDALIEALEALIDVLERGVELGNNIIANIDECIAAVS